jgi:hypothetical protein
MHAMSAVEPTAVTGVRPRPVPTIIASAATVRVVGIPMLLHRDNGGSCGRAS